MELQSANLSRLAVVVCLTILSSCGGSSGSSISGVANDPSDTNQQSLNAEGCAEVINVARISIPTTLINTSSACDYFLDRGVVIENELRIEAGTTILVDQGQSISIDGGSITAIGEPNNRITIRGAQPLTGYWNKIWFRDARSSELRHVDIFDGGNADAPFDGALVVSAQFELSMVDVRVANSYTNGVNLLNGVELIEFSNNRFYDNEYAGLEVYFGLIPQLDSETDYIGIDSPNGRPIVDVNTSGGTIRKVGVATWPEVNAPYGFSLLQLDRGDELTLEPGARLAVRGDSIVSKISVGFESKLILKGTASKPITIESIPSDDRFEEVEVFGGSLELDHAVIKSSEEGIIAESGAMIDVKNTQFESIGSYGINCKVDPFETQTISIGVNVSITNSENGLLDPNCPQ